jgi:HSP20 family molecular chaperone IbpA
MFDVDLWHRPFEFGPRALDIFDPFDDLDMQLNSSVDWLMRPPPGLFAQPRVPQKYRVTVDCAGHDPQNVKTEIRDNKLVVSGVEGGPASANDEDFAHRSFKKTFNLPVRADVDKMTSFMTNRGVLVVDIPYKMDDAQLAVEEAMPRVAKNADGSEEVHLDVKFPDSVDPSKVQVTAKDRDIIVKAENKRQDDNGFSQFQYYRRSTMPQNTDMSGLKCVFDHHKLKITAPTMATAKKLRQADQPIAIEHKK